MIAQDDDPRFDWRRGGAAAVGLIAALILGVLIYFVAASNDDRERALAAERRSYDVALTVRNVSSNIGGAEAALARFVLDEDLTTSGSIYYNDWELAGYQIRQLGKLLRGDPAQRKRIEELEALFNERGAELALAARAATVRKDQSGIGYFYQAGKSGVAQKLDSKLNEIIAAERAALRERIAESQLFSAEAARFTQYLSWLGLIVGFGAIFLGVVAVTALRQNAASRKQAETEADRAEALERAVRDRTQELWEANQALKTEAEERQAAEAQLRQVQKMEAVGQLTGGIAHDFNNMLAVVVGGIDLALRRLNGPRRDVATHLNNAMEGATRAAALTRRLLSFARAEPLLPERVESGALIGTMSDLLDRTLGERITVELDLANDLWPTYVDPHQLENAVLNLAVNARDAMDGEGVLSISAANISVAANQVGDIRPGEYVRISVADTGCGMSPEVLEHAFEPFFTTKPVGKGTGLGLSQIFGFAHQSGGEVGIESEQGKGTTVSLYLPRTTVAAAATIRSHPAARSDQIDQHVEGARILLVEDDPRVRSATVEALEDLDYEPAACSSGAEAITLFADNDYDLVITDVIMPEMTGPELIRHLKATHDKDFAVLFVTGYVGDNETDEFREHELLRKPFTVGALSAAVAGALNRKPSCARGARAASKA